MVKRKLFRNSKPFQAKEKESCSIKMTNHFGILDYVIVSATLLATALIGIYFSRQNVSNDDLLLGGRKLNHWPVALSVMASYISAVTIIGYPSEVFSYGVEIFNMAIIAVIAFPLSVFIFAEFLYSLKLTSLFEYLEHRFECRSLRKMISGIYIFEQIVLAGVILYGPTLVLETFLGIHTSISIFGIGILCTLYTCVGGIRAVVWTDAAQGVIMILGMVVIMVKAFANSGGVSNAFKVANEHGRLDLIQMRLNIFERHNFFNLVIGFGFMSFFRSTIHQQQLQRLSSQPTLSDAKKAMNLSVPISLTVKTVGALTGISLFAIYYNCDPLKLGKIKTMDHLLPYFVVTEMIEIPGVLGLFVACIFSGVLSSISSTLNSLTAVTWEDFLSKIPVFSRMDSIGQANVSRVTGLLYGFLCVLLAFSAQYMGSVYSASYQVIGASNGVLMAIFISGFFVRWINASGAKVGALVGFSTMLTIGIRSLFSEELKPAMLPTSTSNCSEEMLTTLHTFASQTLSSGIDDDEWPQKIFRLSYLMYAPVGAVITMSTAILVSLCTGGCRKAKEIEPKYLHPYVRPSRQMSILPSNCHMETRT